MTPRTRGVRLGKLTLLQVAFAACLASCTGGGSSSSSVPPTQANAANVSATPASLMPPMQVTMPSPRPSPAASLAVSPVLTNLASTAPVPVTMTYAFGAHGTAAQSASRRRITQDAAYTGYTSTAAPISISLNVTPIGGSASNYTGSCAATVTGTSGTCTVTFTASPGPTTFSGTLTEAGNAIASFSQTQIITPGSANAINFTANPVVSSVVVSLGSTSVNGGTATSVPIIVTASDANGNIIAGKQSYVDSSGNSVSFSLSVANAQAGGRGSVRLRGPVRISAPGQASTFASYDGNWLAGASITLTSTSSLIASSAPATLSITPYMANSYSTGSGPRGITVGPDGNLWIAVFNGASLGRITTNGVYTSMSCGVCSSIQYVAAGADGNLWLTRQYTTAMAQMSINGVTTQLNPGYEGAHIRPGPDGNLWYTNGSRLVKMNTTGIALQTTTLACDDIAFGADGNIWCPGTNLYKVSLNGKILGTYTGGSNTLYNGIVAGPDGNVWFTDQTNNYIKKATMNGTVTQYPLQAGATPRGISVGPDGALWFAEIGTNSIGRLTTSGSLTEYGVANGIPSNSAAWDIIAGPDGNIWFTEYGINKVGKFVY